MAIRFAGNLMVMGRVKGAGQLLPVTRLLCLLSLLAFLGFYLGHSLWWLVVLTLAANFIYPTLMPMGEALATRMVVQTHLDYGKVRLCGSFAFIVASTLVGALVGNFGSDWVLHTMVAGLLIMLGLSLLPLRPAPGSWGGAGQGLAARHAQVGPGAPLPAHHRPAAGEPRGLLRFQRHLLEERRLQRHPDRVSLGLWEWWRRSPCSPRTSASSSASGPDPVSGGALAAWCAGCCSAVLPTWRCWCSASCCTGHLLRQSPRRHPLHDPPVARGAADPHPGALCGPGPRHDGGGPDGDLRRAVRAAGGGIFFIMVLVVLPVFVLRLREESP